MGVVLGQAWSESQWKVLMGYLTISTNVRRYQTHHRRHFFFQEDSALVHMHCVCNTVQLLRRCRLSFSWTVPPQQPPAERIDYKIWEVIQQREYESWVKQTEEIKKRLAEFWQCTDTAFKWKNAIFVFPVLPGSAEAQVIWGDTVKRLLTAYFIGNISAKNIKMRSRVSEF